MSLHTNAIQAFVWRDNLICDVRFHVMITIITTWYNHLKILLLYQGLPEAGLFSYCFVQGIHILVNIWDEDKDEQSPDQVDEFSFDFLDPPGSDTVTKEIQSLRIGPPSWSV